MIQPTLVTLLGLMAGVILLVGVSVRLSHHPGEALGSFSKFFLVALRLVIGWHFLVEGLDKLNTPSWTSEGYLREASGPLAPHFRQLAGDRLVDMLTVGPDKTFPAELDIQWQAYLDKLAEFYELTAEQRERLKTVVDQEKSNTVTFLTATKVPVQKPAPYPPPLAVELTMPARLEEYARLQDVLAKAEAELPRLGEDKFAEYKKAKADVNKWRGDLKRDLDAQTTLMKKAVRDQVLFEILRDSVPEGYRTKIVPPKIEANDDAVKKKKEWVNAIRTVEGQIFLEQQKKTELTSQAEKIFRHAYARQLADANSDDPLPVPAPRPLQAWTLLDWSDAIVKYGLVGVGTCLLLGFFTRTACLAGAGFLLMFFLAMPPVPWFPESPRVEGHYLYINKNIIEMFALLALATLRTGRWAGVDGILQLLRPSSWRAAPRSDTVK